MDYTKGKAFGDGKARTVHRVKLTGLKSATRHTYAITPPHQAIPAAASKAGGHRFVTKPPAGKMLYTEAPIAILCYANVVFESRKGPNGKVPPPAVRDDKWFQTNILHHEGMRYFYWLNSKFRLDTKCYYLKVDRPVDCGYLGSSSEEVYKDLKTLADKNGMKPRDFGAVLVVGYTCCYAYPWPTPWWGGRLTYTTGCCFPGANAIWLSTHEFHHLTEGWMRMAGFPVSGEGGYGHADIPWRHPGRFGEHFDFLAHTLRYIPSDRYLNLAVGKLIVADDADGDGVPDNAPGAIWDEKRAGTSPATKFSYKNGLDDLANLTAESLTAAKRGHKHPLLKKEIGLKHHFAVFGYKRERAKKTPTIDGKFDAANWDKYVCTPNNCRPYDPKTPIGKLWPPVPGRDYRMNTYVTWDDNYLYLAARSPNKFMFGMELDCDANGFFRGHDNVVIRLNPGRDEKKVKPNTILPPPGVMVWNNVEPVQKRDMPNWTNNYFDKRDKIRWAWGKDTDGWYTIEVAIPKCTKVGLNLTKGEEIDVRLWMQCFEPPTKKNPNPFWNLGMFDLYGYGYMKLVN